MPDTRAPYAERRHPRVRVALPVELRTGMVLALGTTEDLSIGGMRIAAPVHLDRERDVWLRFNLPTGHSVHARALVVHSQSDGRVGLSFGELGTADHVALTTTLGALLGYTRRGTRVSRRIHLTVRPVGAQESEAEIAETLFVSPHGGLLVSRAHWKLLDKVLVTWPEKQRSAAAKIVYRRHAGPGGLAEFGFNFTDTEDFWQ
ncbi:MAG: PilZ domain-containing protein [Candidatus Koribacter versatilis]|uniref:PilZ domain-containing protein n=1 Tax=Candidatus Korobacter versatilis TaxID=658062 RepID=A0A932A9Q0_9BACT|nr:PilZ domain-containing protein [Candidatus Koribacter versatilis]